MNNLKLAHDLVKNELDFLVDSVDGHSKLKHRLRKALHHLKEAIKHYD